MTRFINNFESVLRSMEGGKYPYYPLDVDGFIKDYKAVTSRVYLRKPGVEAITYYNLQKRSFITRMQLVNFDSLLWILYIIHCISFDELFSELYITEENWEYVEILILMWLREKVFGILDTG